MTRPDVPMPRTLRFLLCVLMVSSAGCASYVSHSVKIRSSLAEGRFDSALEEVEKSESGSSHLLALYERGLILHYAQQYGESNLELHKAEDLYDDLYTKSLSREAGALVTSDVITHFRGERFESAYIHYYKVLNYLHLGDGQGALVECRKLNQKLKTFRDAEDTFYTDDPFLEYLTGIVYESQGDMSDAWVSYRIALEAYENLGGSFNVRYPPDLACDVERAGERLGQMSDRPGPPESPECPEIISGGGAVVLLLETGFAPHKTEVNIVAPILEGELDADDFDADRFALTLADRAGPRRVRAEKVVHWLKIAFPEIVEEPAWTDEVEVIPVEMPTSAVRASRATSIETLVLRRFEERRTRILAKTFARALTKYLAQRAAEKETGRLGGIAVNLFNIATETADTRSWSTLPGHIYLARLFLPEGRYTLQVVLRSGGERQHTIALPDVEVTPGRTTFLNHRVF